MRSFEVALVEVKRLISARPLRLAIVVVCLVPLLYGVLYLWAFWDPYKTLDKLPVALVVEDRPAMVDGKTLDVGSTLASNLKNSDTFDWQTVSASVAASGVKSGKYYMSLTVPRDFSSRLAHADSDNPQRARLQVHVNEATNLLASQISSRVFLEIESSLGQSISKRYLNTIFVSLGDMRTGLERADSGAQKLAKALGVASSGSSTLNNGLSSADSGSRKLSSGLGELASGASSLRGGASKAASGAHKLASGVSSAAGGARSVASGSKSIATGSESVADGLAQLSSLSKTLISSSSSLSSGAAQVDSGVASAASQTKTAASSAGQLSSGADQVKQALEAFAAANPDAAKDSTFQAALAGAGQVSSGASSLSSALSSAVPSLEQLSAGASQVASGAGALTDGLDEYSGAVGRAATGAQKVAGGAEQLSSGADQVASGVDTAADASQQLASGASTLASGSADLATAAAAASSGSSTLTVGLDKLVEGSTKLSAGMKKASSGGDKLAGALDSGTSAIPAFTAKARKARATMMSAPVTLSTDRENEVPNYGTGFAPYFIPLALWVGALMTYFLVRPVSGRALASTLGDPYVALSGLWPAVLITWLQAIIMVLVLQFALGLDPVNPLAFYGFTLIAALSFTAILQLLSAAFGTAGKFVAVVLLMLQLTSAAGTFPLELVPRFFQVINPILPMTYVVFGLREAISGGDLGSVGLNALILLGYTVGAVALTVFTTHRRRMWTMDRLKPVLSL